MKDYLSELCSKANIQLVYMDNKYTVLSCGLKKSIPLIRVHKLFADCPKDIATAIFKYYTDPFNTEKNLNHIKDYVKERLKMARFIIKPPEDKFRENAVNKVMPKAPEKAEKASFVELDIEKITMKDFWGNSISVKPDEAMKIEGSELIELDIEVNDIDKD